MQMCLFSVSRTQPFFRPPAFLRALHKRGNKYPQRDCITFWTNDTVVVSFTSLAANIRITQMTLLKLPSAVTIMFIRSESATTKGRITSNLPCACSSALVITTKQIKKTCFFFQFFSTSFSEAYLRLSCEAINFPLIKQTVS